MRSASPPASQPEPQQLAEVIPLRTPTTAQPPEEVDLAAGVQLAFPLLFVLSGGDQ